MPHQIGATKLKKPKLKRSLSLFEVTIYGVGIILGAGIYVLIGEAAAVAGNAVWLGFLIGAIIAGISGLSYAELGTMFPKEAAEFVYMKNAVKNKISPFLIGWIIIFTDIVAAAAVALGFGGYLYGLTGINMIVGAILLIVGLSALNFWGIKESAKANIIFTAIEIGGLLLIIFLGLPYLGSIDYFEFTDAGFVSIFTAAALVFFAFLGYEDIVNLSEETKKPRKVIPKAIIFSLIITTIIYILVSMVSVSVVPWETLGQSTAPLADVAEAAMPGTSGLLSVIALFATLNTVLILLIVGSRMIYGMANQGSLPAKLCKIHSKRKTPWIAISLLMIVTVSFTLIGNIKTVAQITNFAAFLTFISVNISLILLRYRKPGLRRPFKVPFSIGKFPVLPFLGILLTLLMFFYIDLSAILLGLLVLGAGGVVYKTLNM